MISISITDNYEAKIRSKYDSTVVEIIKLIPGRRWDPDAKLWTIPPEYANALARALELRGFQVSLDDFRQTTQARTSQAAGSDVFQQFIDSLPVTLRKQAWKAVAIILHPDTGGDTISMQKWNKVKPPK